MSVLALSPPSWPSEFNATLAVTKGGHSFYGLTASSYLTNRTWEANNMGDYMFQATTDFIAGQVYLEQGQSCQEKKWRSPMPPQDFLEGAKFINTTTYKGENCSLWSGTWIGMKELTSRWLDESASLLLRAGFNEISHCVYRPKHR